METTFPLLFAAIAGFGHAFEADHLVAVSNIVTRRASFMLAIKDGIYWGLGHSSTIFLIGLLMIVGKATFLNGYFAYFEAGVGLVLILLGLFRLFQFFKYRNRPLHAHTHVHTHSHGDGHVHTHSHLHTHAPAQIHDPASLRYTPEAHDHHHLAYGVGLMHGLAGSGALVLLVMTSIQSSFDSMMYLLLFGLGSVAGMLVAAGVFSLAFTNKLTGNRNLQSGLVLSSSLLCIGYGIYVMVHNLT